MLPQYISSGLKSIQGSMKSPLPTRRALYVPSVLMEKIHFIGTRCCPSYVAMMRQLCVRNFSNSVSMALRHSGIVMASSYDLGIRGSLIVRKHRRLMKSQCVFSKTRKLNSAWSIWPCLICVLSFNARLYQY